jgi:hypothetical protein
MSDRATTLAAALDVPASSGHINEAASIFNLHPADVFVVGLDKGQSKASDHYLYDRRVKSLSLDKDLARDILANGVGVVCKGLVIPDPRKDADEGAMVVAIVDGRQRTRSTRHAHKIAPEGSILPLLPVQVYRGMDEDTAISLSLRLNVKRRQDPPTGLAAKILLLQNRGWSNKRIAQDVSMSVKSVENFVRINQLTPGIMAIVDQGDMSIPMIFDLFPRATIGTEAGNAAQEEFAAEYAEWVKANPKLAMNPRQRNVVYRNYMATNCLTISAADLAEAANPIDADGDEGSDGEGSDGEGSDGTASSNDPLEAGFTPSAKDLRALVASDASKALGNAANAVLLWLVGGADDLSFASFGAALVAARIERDEREAKEAEVKAAAKAKAKADADAAKAEKATRAAAKDAAAKAKVKTAKDAVKAAAKDAKAKAKASEQATAEADASEDAAKEAEGSEEAGTTKAAAKKARTAATKATKAVATAQRKLATAQSKLDKLTGKASAPAPVAPVETSDDSAPAPSGNADADLFANA